MKCECISKNSEPFSVLLGIDESLDTNTGTALTKDLIGGVSQAEVDRANAELGLGISPLVTRKSGQPKLQRQAAQSRKTFRVSRF